MQKEESNFFYVIKILVFICGYGAEEKQCWLFWGIEVLIILIVQITLHGPTGLFDLLNPLL